MWPFKKRDKITERLSEYPACDHLNIALKILLDSKDTESTRVAITEICHAINKANGYFYDYVKDNLKSRGFEGFIK